MKKHLTLIAIVVLTFAMTLLAAGCGEDPAVTVTGVTLNETKISVVMNKEVQLTATVAPDNAADKTVTWSSDNASVATVAAGKVKGISKGTATITAAAGDKKATCVVTVLGETGKIMIGTKSYETIAAAVTAAVANDTITINNGEYTVTETINVDKKLKFVGEAGSVIKTSVANVVFSVTAADVEFDGISIDKTDKGSATAFTMFSMQANGFKVKNGTFTGKYVMDDTEVTRAITPNAGVTGYVIEGNTFKSLRQPAYLEGAGTVTKNHVDVTRGWVICCNHKVTLTDNTFGTNAVDIAIIENNAVAQNAYTEDETIAMSNANSGAFIDQQALKIQVKKGAIVKA